MHRNLGKLYFSFNVWAFPEHKTIYISNPKAACSTIKTHLIELSGVENVTRKGIHGLSPQRIETILQQAETDKADLSDCFVFASVRDPIRRAVSGFNNKFYGPNSFEKRFRKENRVSEGAVIDWAFFVDHLKTTPLARLNPHWRPQHLNLMHGRIRLDQIVRVESLQDDLEKVLLGRFPGKSLTAIRMNATGKNALSAKDIPLRDRLSLLRLYAADLHLYGYGAWWERLITLPDYWSYKRNPARYNARALNRRRLI